MGTIKVDENAINNVVTSPTVRKALYGVYGLLAVLIGAVQVTLTTLGVHDVVWFQAVINVYAYLAIPMGALALTNTPGKDKQVEVADMG